MQEDKGKLDAANSSPAKIRESSSLSYNTWKIPGTLGTSITATTPVYYPASGLVW